MIRLLPAFFALSGAGLQGNEGRLPALLSQYPWQMLDENALVAFSMSELPDSFVRQARLRSAVGK
jgi:hypothetical protein